MTLASVPITTFFFSTTSSNSIPARLKRAIKVNTCSFRDRHGQKLQTSQQKPKALFRILLENCFNFFVSGIFLSSSFLDPVSYALDNAKVKLNHRCQDVSGYYSGIDGLEGAALMKELGSLVSDHKSLAYKEVWEALKILDAADVDYPEASSEVIEIYSLRAVAKELAGKPDGWNREHLWPRSYGLMDGPSLTDLHNLRPADMNVNSARGNKYYGECNDISTHCLRPANREAAPDTETDKQRWAPPLQVRGDIARSVLYMAVCYGFLQPDGSLYLQLSDSPSIERREMGLLSALLQWNELDPPSRAERLRNDRICRFYQHNRNPFVDHPEYAYHIWRHPLPSIPETYSPSMKAWINEFHYNNEGKDRNEFVEIIARSSIDTSTLNLILYNGANGRTYRSLPLSDEKSFAVSDAGSGFLIYTSFIPLQNGPADGIALVSSKEDNHQFEVLQFISYEGSIKAINGPAKGMESVDIMIKETESSSDDDSLGLGGERIGEFEWMKFTGKASPGHLNVGQRIG